MAMAGSCSFSGSTNYTVFLEDSSGMVVEERTVSSADSCNNGSCSITFSTLVCRASILARNQFGTSDIVSSDINGNKNNKVNSGVRFVLMWMYLLIKDGITHYPNIISLSVQAKCLEQQSESHFVLTDYFATGYSYDFLREKYYKQPLISLF